MSFMEIKVCICAAYDWHYLKKSLPLIYKDSECICISIDKNRISWSGRPFLFQEDEFYDFIKSFDIDKKIIIYEDDFHLPELTPIQNECRQRLLMTHKLGSGGWFLQIDSDEYFLDFKGFVSYLKTWRGKSRKVNICCPFINLYKQDKKGYFIINTTDHSNLHFIPMATQNPQYDYGRVNGYFNIKTDFFILHESWARSEAEVRQKIQNWGHSNEVDTEQFLNNWLNVNSENYREYKNFHLLTPRNWPSLIFEPGKDIASLIDNINKKSTFQLKKWRLLLENSITVSRIKATVSKIYR